LKRTFINIILLLIIPAGLYTQDLSGLRERLINTGTGPVIIDTLAVVPGTLQLFDLEGEEIPDSLYTFDPVKSMLSLSPDLYPDTREIKLIYRVFTSDPGLQSAKKDPGLIIPGQSRPDNETARYSYVPVSDNIWKEESLIRSGSISRGISFGNNQDVIVNSNLNLQLSGKLDDNINIIASISDQNIPLQPEGYSQQIHEFDKIFIQLYNDKLSLTLGDFEVQGNQGRFLPLDKKAQGVQFTAVTEPGSGPFNSIVNTTGAAISKGHYHRNSFRGIEGNQGPYKLRGANNELFIIILAGTEQVFIDGRLLTRGVDNDYVIDYNLAEITFTSVMPITKDRRISVEFEYSDRNYARFMLSNTTVLNSENGSYFINIFSEHDAKNQPLRQDLNEDEKQVLASIGDSLHLAWVHKSDSVEFSNDFVLYAKTDTIIDGTVYSIYKHSVDPEVAHFRPGFSYVGENRGNYVLRHTSANGRVFRWTAPVNGIPSGSHEPVTLLVTPKKQQVVSLGGSTALSARTQAFFELAVSNSDLNTFSEIDNDDNRGLAFRLGLDNLIPLGEDGHSLGGGVNYEFSGNQFTTTGRYRPVEHAREWNLEEVSYQGDEQRFSWYGVYNRSIADYINYRGEFMKLSGNYSGLRNIVEAGSGIAGFDSRMMLSYMNSSGNMLETDFLKHSADISRSLWLLRLGFRIGGEHNKIEQTAGQTLSPVSSAFNQWEVYLQNPDTSKVHIFTSYLEREDKLPFDNKLIKSSFAREISAGFRTEASAGNHFAGTVHHRTLEPADISFTLIKPETSLNGRLSSGLRFFNGIIQGAGFYETGSGMEIKKDIMYLEVARGQGTHSWIDYNENGIKELDEFEPAAFPDQADHIRIFIPGDDYIRTRSNQFNQSFRFIPPIRWQQRSGLIKILSFFSNQGAYQISQKTRHPQLIAGLNPFYSRLADTNLISISSSFRNTLTFQIPDKRISIEYLKQVNNSKTLLVNGFDSRQMQSDAIHSRFDATASVILRNRIEMGSKSYQSDFFPGRNFDIDILSGGIDISFQPGFKLQSSLHLNYTRQENNPGYEQADRHNMGTEFSYTIPSMGNITIRADYFHIKFNARENTPLAREMLEGLRPGNNLTFMIQSQKNLTGSLQMSLNYHGRTSPGNKFIHTGGMQMRAYF
jgi:hypothetical protein